MKKNNGDTLMQLADKINNLSKQLYASRIEFCKALAEARIRVVRESNMTWEEWTYNYLRKPNGDHWSVATIRSYVYYGKKPEALDKRQKDAKKNYKKTKVVTRVFSKKGSTDDDQVYVLLHAWKKASRDARKRFLALINCAYDKLAA